MAKIARRLQRAAASLIVSVSFKGMAEPPEPSATSGPGMACRRAATSEARRGWAPASSAAVQASAGLGKRASSRARHPAAEAASSASPGTPGQARLDHLDDRDLPLPACAQSPGHGRADARLAYVGIGAGDVETRRLRHV